MTTLQDVYQKCTCEGLCIYPPSERVDPKLYADFKKVMAANGGTWKGGKTQAFLFKFDPSEILERLQNGEKVNMKKEFDFFETPDELADFLMQVAMPEPGDKILEPEAGNGALVRAANRFISGLQIDCCEVNPICQKELKRQGFKLVGDDFLKYQPGPVYETIIANPPFKEWFEHFYHMYECLKPGCPLYIIAPKGVEFRKDRKHNEWREFMDEKFDEWYIQGISTGSFRSSGTMVETVIVCGWKKAEQPGRFTGQADLFRGTQGELF